MTENMYTVFTLNLLHKFKNWFFYWDLWNEWLCQPTPVISDWSNNSRFLVLPIISPSRVHSVSEMKRPSFVPVLTCSGRDLHTQWFSVNVSNERSCAVRLTFKHYRTVNFMIRSFLCSFQNPSVMMSIFLVFKPFCHDTAECLCTGVELLFRWCFYEFITQATCWVVVSDLSLRWTSLHVRAWDRHFLSDWFIWTWWVILRKNRSLDSQYFQSFVSELFS